MRGHLLDPNIIIAFSIDKLSFGREAAVQSLVVTGSSSRYFIETSCSKGIFLSEVPFLHSDSSSERN
jgi:hypothetical protein